MIRPALPSPVPLPPTTPLPPTPGQIKRAENQLKKLGFSPGAVDGRATAAFTNALKEFQTAWGLPSTGTLDDATRAKLDHTIERKADSKGKLISIGEKSKRIAEFENQLARLGYSVGKRDGIYSRETAEAVKAFRADQKELKDGFGSVREGALKVLAREANALSHAPERRRVKETAASRQLDRATLDASRLGVREGDHSRVVANIQQHLRAAGFDPQRVSGTFDERTTGALKAFQRRSKLEPTGVVDSKTWRELRKARMEATSGTSPAQRLNERSGAVKASEKLLKKLGFNPGKVDGLFDKRTEKAVRAFERQQHMKVDGAIGTGQLAKMKKLSKGVTLGQLHAIMPSLPMSKARAYLPLLNRAMAEANINTRQRKAMFIAQLAHESGSLKFFEELASGAAYEGRLDLGNTQPGDGVRYKGRGPIQLTGRANYRAAGRALGLPLEAHPKMAARPSVGFRTATWFWSSRGLNALADRGDFIGVTRRINGGTNGLADRQAYYRRALKVIH
ncbi:MAG: peptidoglycan-binding protein [Archangium sp.]|nr:peptidoglycan-binding protein [Archangium sp.]